MTKTLNLTDREHWVYVLFAEDEECIYVGCTVNPSGRMQQHYYRSAWWPLVHHAIWRKRPDRWTGLGMERATLVKRRPRFNVIVDQASLKDRAARSAQTRKERAA